MVEGAKCSCEFCANSFFYRTSYLWNTENKAQERQAVDFDRDVEKWREFNEDIGLNPESSQLDDTATETQIMEIFQIEILTKEGSYIQNLLKVLQEADI